MLAPAPCRCLATPLWLQAREQARLERRRNLSLCCANPPAAAEGTLGESCWARMAPSPWLLLRSCSGWRAPDFTLSWKDRPGWGFFSSRSVLPPLRLPLQVSLNPPASFAPPSPFLPRPFSLLFPCCCFPFLTKAPLLMLLSQSPLYFPIYLICSVMPFISFFLFLFPNHQCHPQHLPLIQSCRFRVFG